MTFPARQYSVNGERRSFALLRPADGRQPSAQEPIREAILEAYTRFEAKPERFLGKTPRRPDLRPAAWAAVGRIVRIESREG